MVHLVGFYYKKRGVKSHNGLRAEGEKYNTVLSQIYISMTTRKSNDRLA